MGKSRFDCLNEDHKESVEAVFNRTYVSNSEEKELNLPPLRLEYLVDEYLSGGFTFVKKSASFLEQVVLSERDAHESVVANYSYNGRRK
ncbi:MAG: hypothetical protein R3222_02065, partial [Balneolaceae bacterium]|nr:hypothetical protein [Balneolaceae bacterium]